MQIREVRMPEGARVYDDELLLDIEQGVVSVLVRGRNAWRNTWVRHYFQNAALYPRNRDARAGAERLRGPGNVFYIRETRALLLRGPQRGILVCDSRTTVPFDDYVGDQRLVVGDDPDRWVHGLYPGVSLWDAFKTFEVRSEFWSNQSRGEFALKSGEVTSTFEFDAHSGPLTSWKSRAEGSEYPLGWSRTGEDPNISSDALVRICRYWESQLRSVRPADDSRPRPSIGELSAYRETYIGALPRSVWRSKRIGEVAAARQRLSDAEENRKAAFAEYSEAQRNLEVAQDRTERAKLSFLKPADTSAGIRQQREEAARAQRELVAAEAHRSESRERWILAEQAATSARSEKLIVDPWG